MHPSPERDAIAARALAAIGDPTVCEAAFGQMRDGKAYAGVRLREVPKELEALALRPGSVVTTVNGSPVLDPKALQAAVESHLKVAGHPRVLFVQYVRDDALHAIEYRLL
jgi:S1-C subfamily serine protease